MDPYGTPKDVPSMSYYIGVIRYMDMTEAYMPDIVTRQFGRVQRIPAYPIEPTRCRLSRSTKSYVKEYGCNDSLWQRFQQVQYRPADMGELVTYPGEAAITYMPLFTRVTHMRVGNPGHDLGIDEDAVDPGTQSTLARQVIQKMQTSVVHLTAMLDDPEAVIPAQYRPMMLRWHALLSGRRV